MKKYINYTFMLFALLAISLAFNACGDDKEDEKNPPASKNASVVGIWKCTWEADRYEIIVFNEDKTTRVIDFENGQYVKDVMGTYEYNKNAETISITEEYDDTKQTITNTIISLDEKKVLVMKDSQNSVNTYLWYTEALPNYPATGESTHQEPTDSIVETETVTYTPNHSISGTILKADGTNLMGATVKINGSSVSVSGNTFARDGLVDGTYNISISCPGYKGYEETVDLTNETINGMTTAKNISRAYYMARESSSTGLVLGGPQNSDEITIETTEFTNADGDNVNDTDERIIVQTETPVITGDASDETTDLGIINRQIKDQSNGTRDINDFRILLSNITSLEDAQAIARANKVATSRTTRSTTAMPYNNELLAGVAVNAGPYVINLPAGKTFTITIKMPDDVKKAITLFRTIRGDSWTRVDMNNPAEGITSIDTSTSGIIKINMNKIQTQSLGFGFVVNVSGVDTYYGNIEADPIINGDTPRSISSMPYTVKAGTVLSHSSRSALTDFLRKIVVRKYGTRIVREAKTVTRNCAFQPAYTMHANWVLYLSGKQEVTVKTFSVMNSDAKFTTTEYGEAFVYCYEVDPNEEPIHGGGTN